MRSPKVTRPCDRGPGRDGSRAGGRCPGRDGGHDTQDGLQSGRDHHPAGSGRPRRGAARGHIARRGGNPRPAVRHTPAPDPTDLGAEFATDLTSLTAAGGSVVVDHGDLADPSDSVVQIAQRRDARLIVVGLRHRTPVGRMLLGSTAQRILLDATRPVLAVKAVRHRDDQLAAEVRSFRAGSMATRM